MLDYLFSRFKSQTLSTNGLNTENFLARSKRDFLHVPKSEHIIVCIPGWGQKIEKWSRVKKYAEKTGSSFLTYQFPREIFSSDYVLTKQMLNLINDNIRKDIKDLKHRHGLKECTLVTLSLGSSYGSMVYRENTDINHILLVVPGNNVAEDAWNSCRTDYIKKSYEEQGLTLEQLKNYWKDLSPDNNLPTKNANIMVIYGKYDKVINYEESKKLALEMKDTRLNVSVQVYPLEHYFVSLYFLIFPSHFLRKLNKIKKPSPKKQSLG